MQHHLQAVSPDELLRHDAWIRRLAAGLLSDPERAADAVQDAWLSALERPPARSDDLRAWFARVTRRRAVDGIRRDAARDAREAADVPGAGATPAGRASSAELARRAELQRDVADGLLALDEPYRTTLLLRFFEDLPPREIAARTGRPVNTVRTHLERGLAQLRERLDGRYGDRTTWASAIVALATRGGAKAEAVTVTSVLLAYASARWLAAAAVLVLVGAWLAWRAADVTPEPAITVASQPREPEPSAGGDDAADVLAPAAAAGATRRPAEQTRLEAKTVAPPVDPIAPSDGAPVNGVLVDEEGRPFAGRAVLLVPRDLPRWGGEDDRWFGTETHRTHFPAELWGELQAHPSAIEDFFRHAADPALFAAAFRGEFEPPRAVTDALGCFTLAPGEGPPARYADAELELEDPDLELLFAVESSDREDGRLVCVAAPQVTLAGRVVDEAGAPVPNASIQVRHELDRIAGFPYRTDSDHSKSHLHVLGDDGAFEIELPRTGGTTVEASADGFRREEIALPRESRRDLVVTLERRAPVRSVLRGIVLDADGAPVEGAGLGLGYNTAWSAADGRFEMELASSYRSEDALYAGSREKGYAVLPGIGAQAHERGGLDDVVVRLDGPSLPIAGVLVDADGRPLAGIDVNTVEITPLGGIYGGAEGLNGGRGTTAADGGFRLEGLARHAYRLRFLRGDPPFYLETAPIEAGTEDARIVVPADWSRPALAGRVVDRFGRPIAGALVAIGMDKLSVPNGRSYLTVGEVHSAADGGFRLADVPRRGVTIHVRGAGVAITNYAVEELAEGDVTLVAPRELRFRIELAADDPADGFQLLDASGEVLAVEESRIDGTSFFHVIPRREGGAFGICVTTDAAETIVFTRDGAELRRTSFDAFAEPPREALVTLTY